MLPIEASSREAVRSYEYLRVHYDIPIEDQQFIEIGIIVPIKGTEYSAKLTFLCGMYSDWLFLQSDSVLEELLAIEAQLFLP